MAVNECRLCGRVGPTEVHHVFSGSYRKRSDEFGATVNLCPECHRYIHSGKGVEAKRQLQCEVQYEVMDANEWTLRDWFLIFGKSWI